MLTLSVNDEGYLKKKCIVYIKFDTYVYICFHLYNDPHELLKSQTHSMCLRCLKHWYLKWVLGQQPTLVLLYACG
jgi:hypothetical protein